MGDLDIGGRQQAAQFGQFALATDAAFRTIGSTSDCVRFSFLRTRSMMPAVTAISRL